MFYWKVSEIKGPLCCPWISEKVFLLISEIFLLLKFLTGSPSKGFWILKKSFWNCGLHSGTALVSTAPWTKFFTPTLPPIQGQTLQTLRCCTRFFCVLGKVSAIFYSVYNQSYFKVFKSYYFLLLLKEIIWQNYKNIWKFV